MQDVYQTTERLRIIEIIAGITLGTTLLSALGCFLCPAHSLFIPDRLHPEKIAVEFVPDKTSVLGKNDSVAWKASVFQKSTIKKNELDSSWSKRYRLAGTFFAGSERQMSRQAIIDDLQTRDQKLLGVGDSLNEDGVIVSAIYPDHVKLRLADREEILRLLFAGGPPVMDDKTALTSAGSDAGVAMLARFGKRVEDRRWLLKRDALMDYYRELMNDTERLAKVFESLKPVYRNSRISGYVLDIVAEKSMFQAFGLRQNDVIHKVNSMPMTSQRRAEYFISEFVKNRVNGFVLDFERDGKPQKFIYLVR